MWRRENVAIIRAEPFEEREKYNFWVLLVLCKVTLNTFTATSEPEATDCMYVMQEIGKPHVWSHNHKNSQHGQQGPCIFPNTWGASSTNLTVPAYWRTR